MQHYHHLFYFQLVIILKPMEVTLINNEKRIQLEIKSECWASCHAGTESILIAWLSPVLYLCVKQIFSVLSYLLFLLLKLKEPAHQTDRQKYFFKVTLVMVKIKFSFCHQQQLFGYSNIYHQGIAQIIRTPAAQPKNNKGKLQLIKMCSH